MTATFETAKMAQKSPTCPASVTSDVAAWTPLRVAAGKDSMDTGRPNPRWRTGRGITVPVRPTMTLPVPMLVTTVLISATASLVWQVRDQMQMFV